MIVGDHNADRDHGRLSPALISAVGSTATEPSGKVARTSVPSPDRETTSK